MCYLDLQEYGFGLKTKWRFCLYRGSISITKPKFKLQPHLVLQQDIYQKVHFKEKMTVPIIFKKGTLNHFFFYVEICF